MTELPDGEQRAEESRREDDDKYHQRRDDERAERADRAEGLDEDLPPRDED